MIEQEGNPGRDVDMPERFVSWILVGSVVLVGATALLGYLGHGRQLISVEPGGAVFADRVLPIFFLIFLASAIVALKWPLVGGMIASFGVAALGPFAAMHLELWSAALVIVVFALPAVVWLYLATSHRRRPPAGETNLSRRRALFTIAGFMVAVVGGSAAGRFIYDRIWGPTHPESATSRPPSSAIDWLWSGAVTASAGVVRARPREPFERARLLVGTSPDLDGARALEYTDVFDRVLEFRLGELDADTRYHYGVEVDGVLDTVRTGSLRTFPTEREPVRIAFGSCARVGSNGQVFDAIRELDPAIYVCLGDFHYGDNFVDNVDDYRQVFDVQLTQPAQAALYGRTPIAYVWDDHDYGPNDSDRDAVGRNAAMVAYREYVPHYELAGPDSAIYQAFSVGRVRVVLTDARSARDPHRVRDTAAKSMLGIDQRNWLLDELRSSSASHDLVIWVNPVPWIDEADEGGDSWSGYTHERAIIADHIADRGIDNLVMVAGDAHMVAIDDGTHTNYSSEPGPAFPLMHVAALDRPGSTKGGPYTQGPIAGGGQFGVVEVAVDGGQAGVAELAVELAALNWRGERLLHHRFTVPLRGV